MSRASRRFYRSILLGTAALGFLVWAAIEQFGIPREEMTALFMGTVWIALGIIVISAVIAGLWVGLRRWLRSGETD